MTASEGLVPGVWRAPSLQAVEPGDSAALPDGAPKTAAALPDTPAPGSICGHRMNAALQRIGAPPAAVSTPARGRYQQVIVLDEFRQASVSLNAGDKLGDVTHGEMVLAIVNAGINGGRRPHEAGWVPGLLSGPCELRYRGQLAFFTHDAAGRLQPLANDSGFSARQPSANSWATPAAIPR